jgi:hypothetical protein
MLLDIPFGGLDGLGLILFLLALMIWSIALVAIANGKFYDNTTKLCWFLIVLIANLLGVLLFVLWGRQQVAGSKQQST